jgi:hypothetical protein
MFLGKEYLSAPQQERDLRFSYWHIDHDGSIRQVLVLPDGGIIRPLTR